LKQVKHILQKYRLADNIKTVSTAGTALIMDQAACKMRRAACKKLIIQIVPTSGQVHWT
jgi:hypothetical protein